LLVLILCRPTCAGFQGAAEFGRKILPIIFGLAVPKRNWHHIMIKGAEVPMNKDKIMRVIIAFGLAMAMLSACTGHQYETPKSGVSVSGTAGVGVKYNGGKVSPKQNSSLTISLGGAI
jgi:hypothetical protein